jgi:hypothetical protein
VCRSSRNGREAAYKVLQRSIQKFFQSRSTGRRCAPRPFEVAGQGAGGYVRSEVGARI